MKVKWSPGLAGCARSVAAVACFVLAGCGDIIAPDRDVDVRIQVSVSGGIAGVSYGFELDGPDGVVRGLSCTLGCDFEPGEILLAVSPEQVTRTAREMRDAGILQLDGIDFGSLCCDMFGYAITYEEGDRTSTVQGDTGTLPPLLLQAVDRLQGMVDGRLPILVALQSTADRFPSDPLTLDEAKIAGHVLEASVTYGGGCTEHEIDLVAFNGWLESFPVQVDVLLSHEDNDDLCDALVIETRRFDLRPLAEAYREAYGAGPPDETTLVLRLRDPQDPSEPRLLEYRF